MRHLLIIVSRPQNEAWAHQLVTACGCQQSTVLVTSLAEAAQHLAREHISPSHVVFDIGMGGVEVLADVDALAHQCEPGTRVFAVGDTNDIHLYRGILQRGVIDYLPMPASVEDIVKALRSAPPAPTDSPAANGEKRVIVFMSAASGDGSSTAALNAAHAMSQYFNGTTVLVDMDYQFGMVAKQLGLQNQYGIRDLFDFPDRGIDGILIKRMVASYGKLHVITAPAELRYLPVVSPDSIRDLIATLKLSYDNVIIDLPHAWLPWVSAAAQQSTHLVLVAQLWLKSVSHAARLMRSYRELNIPLSRIVTVVNRHGARFNETIEAKDFERVCGAPVRFTLANDIKTVVEAEGLAHTVMEQPVSQLSEDIHRLARHLSGLPPAETKAVKRPGGFFSRSKG